MIPSKAGGWMATTIVAITILTGGCGNSPGDGTDPDTHADGLDDGSVDTSVDPGVDPDTDLPTDAPVDLPLDTTVDPSTDTATDDPTDTAHDDVPIVGLAYPERDTYRIKGIQPDFWPDMDELAGHNTGTVAMNLVWDIWEPSVQSPPCSGTQQEYDNHCFNVDAGVDAAIAGWTSRGVIVTAIVYGVPAWARVGNTGCSPISAPFERFCTPDDAADYARFAGMIAERYDGLHGHGRIADFVIHNEVNSNIWFDIGCGQGTPCNQTQWIQTYADNYAGAYDAIKTHQSEAKVLLSFEHHFDVEFDRPEDDNAMISVKTFVTQFDTLIGTRQWMIAYHPYGPDLRAPDFSPLDLPRVTYGNIGVLLAWLRTTFPTKPHTWQVQLTESGINSATPDSSEAAQAPAVCDTLRNVLGTPGIESYIYHRLRDCDTEDGLMLGLIRSNDTYKPSFAVWAMANHIDDTPPVLDCGFEHLPYTRLVRSHKELTLDDIHWISSRIAPEDFVEDQAWFLLREPESGTEPLYECLVENVVVGPHTFLSFDVGCGGHQSMGPVGHIWTSAFTGSVALFQCTNSPGWDHYVTTDPGCEGGILDTYLGHARP